MLLVGLLFVGVGVALLIASSNLHVELNRPRDTYRITRTSYFRSKVQKGALSGIAAIALNPTIDGQHWWYSK